MLKTKDVYEAVRTSWGSLLAAAGFTTRKKGARPSWSRHRDDGRVVHLKVEVPRGMPWVNVEVGVAASGAEATFYPIQQVAMKSPRPDQTPPLTPRMRAPGSRRLPSSTEALLGAWVEKLSSRLVACIQDTVGFHDALHQVFDGAEPSAWAGERVLRFERASAYVGGYERVGSLAGAAGQARFSADGRWIALLEAERIRIIDPRTCEVVGAVPVPQARLPHAVSPDGTSLAVRTDRSLQIRDSNGVRVEVARPLAPKFGVAMLFDHEGRLWLADVDADGRHRLQVLDGESLERLSCAAVPPFPTHLAPTDPPSWHEPSFVLHPGSGTIVLSHMAGDSFVSVTFHRLVDGQLVTAPRQVELEGWDSRAINDVVVHPSGQEIFANDGGGLVGFSLPGCRVIEQGMPDAPPDDAQVAAMTHLGGAVMLAMADDDDWCDEVYCLDPDTLLLTDRRPILHPKLWRVDLAGEWLAGLAGRELQVRKLSGTVHDAVRISAHGDPRTEAVYLRDAQTGQIAEVTSNTLWTRALPG